MISLEYCGISNRMENLKLRKISSISGNKIGRGKCLQNSPSSRFRTILAGLLGGVTLVTGMLLTFRLLGFGWNGGGVLLDPAIQSHKLILVWTEIQPLPLIISNPVPIVFGLILFSIAHAFVYRWLAPAWPAGIPARAIRIATLVFCLSFLFFEFFTPFNLFGEPPLLIGLELSFWAIIAAAEAIVVAATFEWKA